jgi:hypothetical protein
MNMFKYDGIVGNMKGSRLCAEKYRYDRGYPMGDYFYDALTEPFLGPITVEDICYALVMYALYKGVIGG